MEEMVGRTNTELQQLTQSLGIDKAPESWRLNWEASAYSRVDETISYDLPDDIASLLDLPDESVPLLVQAAEIVRGNSDMAELAALWHFIIYHLEGPPQDNPSEWPIPEKAMGEAARMFPLVAYISGLEHPLANHRRRGIPMEVTRKTFGDVGRWVRLYHKAHGKWGFGELIWLRKHAKANLFEIGRLQYGPAVFGYQIRVFREKNTGQIFVIDDRSDNPVALPKDGDWEQVVGPESDTLSIHIPAGSKLSHEECDESFRLAKEMLPKWYPERHFVAFTCYSWLVDPALSEILPASSNIAYFQSKFHALPESRDEGMTYGRVFGSSSIDITKAPRDTSLQRAIIDYVSKGGKMCCPLAISLW